MNNPSQEAKYSRKMPLQSGMTGRVLARLILGERITHRSFDAVAATYRLSVPVERLRNKHLWPINDLWLWCKTRDGNRRARYKEFFLDPEILSTLTPDEFEWARETLSREALRAA